MNEEIRVCDCEDMADYYQKKYEQGKKQLAALQKQISGYLKLLQADDETITGKDEEMKELNEKIEEQNEIIKNKSKYCDKCEMGSIVLEDKLKAEVAELKRESEIWEKQSLSKLSKNNQGLRNGIENLKVKLAKEDKENIILENLLNVSDKGWGEDQKFCRKLITENKKLKAEVAELETKINRLKEMSAVEMMCENENVNSHITEWEKRCLNAESELSALKENRKVDEGKIEEILLKFSGSDGVAEICVWEDDYPKLAHAIAEELALNKGEVR